MSGPCGGASRGGSDLGPIAEYLEVEGGLVLRAPSLDDAAILFAEVDKNRVYLRDWLPWLDRTMTAEDEASFLLTAIEDRAAGKSALWLILENGELVGTLSLNWIDEQNRGCAVGYWLSEEMTGRGIITRSCERLMQHCFEDVGFHRFVLEAAVENRGSRAIAERLGMRQEGVHKDREWLYDHWVDSALYAITAMEWKSS